MIIWAMNGGVQKCVPSTWHGCLKSYNNNFTYTGDLLVRTLNKHLIAQYYNCIQY